MGVSAGRSIELFEQDCSGVIVREFAGGDICVYSAKDPGKETVNEDAVGIVSCSQASGVLIVADGLGGLPGGEKASAIAIGEISSAIEHGFDAGQAFRESILDGIEHANQIIQDTAAGAATTVIAVEVIDGQVRCYHVGDSIALLTGQKGKLKYQTIAHSPVGYALESGLMHEDDAMTHDERHIISNVVGSSDMRLEIGPLMKMAKRDTLVLGSDGLFDNLAIGEIIEIIRCGSLAQCAGELVTIAVERMSHATDATLHKPDDMSFVLYRPGS